MPRRLPALLLCLALGGCGTDVFCLLDDEGLQSWEADRLATAATEAQPGLAAALYQAEEEKLEACAEINEAVRQRLDRPHVPFFEALVADLGRVAILILPIASVERCWQAHETYAEELDSLRLRLAAMGLTETEESAPSGEDPIWAGPAAAENPCRGR